MSNTTNVPDLVKTIIKILSKVLNIIKQDICPEEKKVGK